MAYGNSKAEPIYISRVINTSADDLFDVLTRPEYVKLWWGPLNFTCPFFQNEPRLGGRYLACMESPAGKEYWTTGEYKVFREGETLIFTDSFSDKDGNILSAQDYGMSGDWPQECLISFALAGLQNQTTLTLEHAGIPEEERMDCMKSWNECFVKLNELVSAMDAVRRPSHRDATSSYYEPSRF